MAAKKGNQYAKKGKRKCQNYPFCKVRIPDDARANMTYHSVTCKKYGKMYRKMNGLVPIGEKNIQKTLYYHISRLMKKKGTINYKGRGKYVKIFLPNHPYSKGKTYQEHRYVVEQYLKKEIPKHEALTSINGQMVLNKKWIVHHVNGDKSNNKIYNLYLFPDEFLHTKFHDFLNKLLKDK